MIFKSIWYLIIKTNMNVFSFTLDQKAFIFYLLIYKTYGLKIFLIQKLDSKFQRQLIVQANLLGTVVSKNAHHECHSPHPHLHHL